MKRFFVLLLIILLSGVSCSCGKNEVEPILCGISFIADISYYNESYSCETVIDKEGSMTLTATAPEDIKGLTLKMDGDTVTAEYLGIVYTPKSDSIPIGSVADNIYCIIADVIKNGKTADFNKENCTLEGKLDSKSYKFIFSPSGLPLSLEIPDSSFKIIFKNVTQISK